MNLLIALPGAAEWIIILTVLGLVLIPKIFYLISLQSTLDVISFGNRKMPSSNVWLLLIPLFGVVWHFIIVSNMADSIKAEADSKNITLSEPRPAYNIGLAMCILNCLFFIPGINIFTGIASFVCWILYWVKINSYKNRLLMEAYNMIGTNS
jgi:hypothetical protein